MKHLKRLASIALLALQLAPGVAGAFDLAGAFNLGGGDSTVGTLDQWKATTSPTAAITQRVADRGIRLTGFGAGGCLGLDAQGNLSANGTPCGAGSGFSTTSADYWILASTTIPKVGGASYGDLIGWTGSSWGKFATSSLGISSSPGGADTYVQFNDRGAFAGDSHFTFSSSTDTLHVHAIGGDATDGLILEAANGTDVGILGAANSTNATWYGAHNFGGRVANLRTALGTTPADGFYLENSTAAAAGAQQISPSLRFSGRGWNSGGAGSSQAIDARTYLLPVQGASGAHGTLKTQFSRNGAAFYDVWTQSSTGEAVINVQSSVSATTGLEINAPFGNSTPGTTRLLRLNSTSGYSIVDFTHSGTLRQSIVGASGGALDLYASGGNYFSFYSGNSGLTSNTLMAQIVPVGFYNNGGNFNAGRVTAGQANTSPPATFSNYGSTALKTAVITTPTTLDDTVTQAIVDCSSYNICSGTPSQTACSTYTGSGQSTCESHLPCSWNAGSSCSAFDNESGMGTCAGTSGCSVVTSGCSGGDEGTCLANDDAYGGSCAWTLGSNTCPSYTNTSSCNGASPCYATTGGDCNTLSDGGGDGSACATQPECSYDSGSGVCSGSYFTSCDGDNSTYSCTGNYNTGSCSGTYGVSCDGTATCVGYGDSGSCAGESGCSWISGVDVTLPASPIEKTYWIAKDYTSGTLRILPNSGQTVNNTTSITSTSTAGKSWMLTWIESKSNWYVMSEH